MYSKNDIGHLKCLLGMLNLKEIFYGSIMKKSQELLKEITDLTYKIETNYPELYQFLDENPITISEGENLKINMSTLQNYFTSLEELLDTYRETHGKK